MSTTDLDVQRERATRNQALFREVNNRINEISSAFDVAEAAYVCECLDPDCLQKVAVPQQEYRRIRRQPTEFIVVPGHEQLNVEQVVERDTHWVVVRKVGAGAVVAAELAQPQG